MNKGAEQTFGKYQHIGGKDQVEVTKIREGISRKEVEN
jgi:hypothetical protein